MVLNRNLETGIITIATGFFASDLQ